MTSRVGFHTDVLMAEMMRNLLELNGLHPLPLNLAAAVKPLQGARGPEIYVPDEEAIQARKILLEHRVARQFVISD